MVNVGEYTIFHGSFGGLIQKRTMLGGSNPSERYAQSHGSPKETLQGPVPQNSR